MKRGLLIATSLCLVLVGGYFAFSKLAIRHETLNLFDAARNRPVPVDITVRRNAECKAGAGITTLPIAIVSHGNTVKNTEYSFLANVLATRGYLVASIQHDLPGDAPLMTEEGSLFVGRLGVYERGEQNILFAIGQLKKIEPNADYDRLTLVGHSNGGDISMFFAQQHPELVQKLVTLDNLRVPMLRSGPKILSFRSKDPVFKADPGVIPDDKDAKKAGIDLVWTHAQHADMSDRGPASVKTSIQNNLNQFLSDNSNSKLRPADTEKLIIFDPTGMRP